MLSHPIQADGLIAPALRGVTASNHWSKRAVLALLFGLSALCWVGLAEVVNALV